MPRTVEVVPSKPSERQKVCQVIIVLVFFYFHVTDWCRILIILGLEVLQELGEFEKLGEPKPLENRAEEDEKTQPTTISGNGFYGSKAQGPQMPANTRAPPTRSNALASSHATIYPIEAISPYNNKWTIKARCTTKSNIKTWHNRNGEGKLFSVNLLDDSGEFFLMQLQHVIMVTSNFIVLRALVPANVWQKFACVTEMYVTSYSCTWTEATWTLTLTLGLAIY